jgi:hypothetical protein
MNLKEKTKEYLKGLTCTKELIIGKVNKDGNVENPCAIMITRGTEKDKDGRTLPAGLQVLVPFLPSGFGPLKRRAIISESNEIEEELIISYQKFTSKIATPTLSEINKININ